jgi:hypothetical protein
VFTKSKILKIVPHILVWGILFFFPLLFSYGDNPKISKIYIKNWLPLLFAAIIFYFNYLYLIEKFLHNNNKIGLFILLNILLIPVLIVLMEAIKNQVFDTTEFKSHHFHKKKPWLWLYLRSGFSLMLTTGVALGVSMTEKWIKTERERKAMENEHLKSELTHLKYQLQPHFFFNSLNNIYSLIDAAPDKAKEIVHGLGKLMRYLLYDAEAPNISLEKEIDFIKKFIELMRIRLTDKVSIESRFPSGAESIDIPPLLLIPLVENAFKHGVSSLENSTIKMELKIENQQLIFKVENTYFPKNKSDKGGSGIGIENLKKRLSKLYPGNYALKSEVKNNLYISELKISL